MILFDTGPLAALVNAKDRHHARAEALFRDVLAGRWGAPLSTDFVLDEGLTLLQVRTRDRAAGETFAVLFHGRRDGFASPLTTRTTTPDILEEAVELHFRHYDRGLSVTDCTLIVHAERTGAAVATSDGHWGGLASLVEW